MDLDKEDKRVRKIGIKDLLLKNNSMWYVKLLKAKHFEFNNRVAQSTIDLNKKIINK